MIFIFIKNKIFSLSVVLIFFVLVINGKDSKKIKGGKIAAITDVNFQVSVQLNGNHICGGFIISEYHVLTTATCVSLNQNVVYANIKIRSGSNYLSQNRSSDVRFHDVSFLAIHPDYNMYDFWANDICLIKIVEEMKINRWNRESVLLSREFSIYKFYWISGWGGNPGAHSPEIVPTDHLRKIRIISLRLSKCVKLFQVNLNRKQHCASSIPRTSYITLGDSGNPVFSKRKIYGLVSVVSTLEDAPILFTKIPSYTHWIYETMNKH